MFGIRSTPRIAAIAAAAAASGCLVLSGCGGGSAGGATGSASGGSASGGSAPAAGTPAALPSAKLTGHFCTDFTNLSHNLPKVPGVGDKTAESLARRFGDAATLLTRLDDVTPLALRETLRKVDPDLAVEVIGTGQTVLAGASVFRRAAGMTAPTGGQLPRIPGVRYADHVAFTVPDLDQSVQFFVSVSRVMMPARRFYFTLMIVPARLARLLRG